MDGLKFKKKQFCGRLLWSSVIKIFIIEWSCVHIRATDTRWIISHIDLLLNCTYLLFFQKTENEFKICPYRALGIVQALTLK